MNKNKGIRCFLIFTAALFITSCISKPPTPTVKVETNSQPIQPVLVSLSKDAGQSVLNFHCYESSDCYDPITLPERMEWLLAAEFDLEGNLLMPFRISNIIGFMVVSKTSHKFITAPESNVGAYDMHTRMFSQGKMIYQTVGAEQIYILDQSGNVKEVRIQADMASLGINVRLEKDKNGNIIAYNGYPIHKEGGSFIAVNFIDLQTHQVETRQFPAPEEIRNPRKKYDVHIDAILNDGEVLLYQYRDETSKLNLNLFDVRTKKDIAPQIFNFGPYGYFKEYKGIVYLDGYQPYILKASNFTPLIKFEDKKVKNIPFVPFGDFFLVKLGDKIVQVDLSGKILKEYPFPIELKEIQYRIAGYEN